MRDRFMEFYNDEIIGKKGRHEYPNIPLDFLQDNDIYLHFTNKSNLDSILLNGILNDLNPKGNERKAGYYTKDARDGWGGSACLAVDLSGLLDPAKEDELWGFDKSSIGLPIVWFKRIVPRERIIGHWTYSNEEGAKFNEEYYGDIR